MNAFKITLSFVLGAAAGVATGLLMAPKSGKQTRKQLSKEYDSMVDSLEDAANSKLKEAKTLLNETVARQAKQGKSMIDTMKEKIMVK